MDLTFFIKSSTINIDNYTLKDIPGSSGRLDVISRCILATLLNKDRFEKNCQIWVFLDRYGTYIFNPEFFNYETFPKNELLFTDYFVGFLRKRHYTEDLRSNPLKSVNYSEMDLIESIIYFQKLKYDLYLLHEQSKDSFNELSSIKKKEKIVFILGSQDDEYLNSNEILALQIPTISLGNQSYLASSVIRLLKLYILAL
ncbi:MAG: hypothetical protein ACFE9I_02965 [Candidatus Hermodarchaeota archaeon]